MAPDRPRRESPEWTAVGLILGALLFAVGAFGALGTYRFISRAVAVQATVLDIETVHGKTDGFVPTFRFTTKNGESYVVRGRTEGAAAGLRVGGTMPVLYDPASPSDARLDTFSLWRAEAWLIGIGLFLLAAAGLRIRDRAAKEPPIGSIGRP